MLLPTLAALICFTQRIDGGKILVVPADGSHWLNMKVLIQKLHSRGHNISVIRPQTSPNIETGSDYYQLINLDLLPGFNANNLKYFAATIQQLRLEFHTSPLAYSKAAIEFLTMLHNVHKGMTYRMKMVFEDGKLMQLLKESEFDVVLTDPCFGGGVLLAHRLGLPLVFNVRWLILEDAHFRVAPSPLSYVPIPGTELTDKMSFWQRVKNVLFFFIISYAQVTIKQHYYDPFVQHYFGSDVRYDDLVLAADIWLMRSDFTLEFPRPTMPNIVHVGGFQCKPSKPLPQHLEDFVQSSAEHGVIIMSLGTLVETLPENVTEHVAAAFAQLPQKIIWRHIGKRPSTLGNNTLLLAWLPQNDLLGHPKTRVFVSHGGTNSLQEAIYHGVPVVGLPLMFDQDDNLFRMKTRGVAKVVDIGKLNKDNFLHTVKAVLHDTFFRENMQKLSRLHRDQPMKPLDKAMFWIEFVMRHKGADHLKSHRMSWIQYHSIDVIALLLFSVMMISFCSILTVKCLCLKIIGERRVRSE